MLEVAEVPISAEVPMSRLQVNTSLRNAKGEGDDKIRNTYELVKLNKGSTEEDR